MLDKVKTIGVFGTFNSGKSTFINGLLGRRICKISLFPQTIEIFEKLKQQYHQYKFLIKEKKKINPFFIIMKMMKNLKRLKISLTNPIEKEIHMSTLETKIESLKRTFSDYQTLNHELDQIREKSTRNLKLAVVGEQNAGKSTFINAILGDRILPSGISDTTAFATYIHYSRIRCIHVILKNGESEVLPIEELHKFKHQNKKKQSSFIQIDSAEQIDINDIMEINVMVNCDFLKGLTLIDTPGFNSSKNREQNDAITEALLDDADGVIWLTRADQVASRTELEKIKKNVYQYKDRSICLISKIDTIRETDLKDVLSQAKSVFDKHFLYYEPIAAEQELTKQNKLGLDRFYSIFNTSIKPLMRNWVIKSLEQEVFTLIKDVIEIKESQKSNIQKIDKDIENLYQKLEKVRQGILPEVKNISLSFKSHINNMLQDLNSQLRTNMDYWDTEEPFEVRKEGFFTDDYYVEYREVSYYKYSDYGLEKAHNKVYEDFYKYFDQFNQSMLSKLEKYHEEINTLLDQFGNDQEDALDDIDFTMDLHKQYFFNNSEDRHDYIENKSSWEGYFYSGMRCGGVYSLNLKAYLIKYKNKPSYNDLKKELSLFLPLDKLIEMLDEYHNNFSKSTQKNLANASRFFKYYIPSLSSNLDSEIEEFKNALKIISK